MIPRQKPSYGPVFLPPSAPLWLSERDSAADEAEAAFTAGAALAVIDAIVLAEPIWGGAWRNRLALRCATQSVRFAGRAEGEAELRDGWAMLRSGDDPGPAGHVLLAWRRLAAGSTKRLAAMQADDVGALADALGVRRYAALADLPHWFDQLAAGNRAAPLAALELLRRIMADHPSAEPLAWWMADLLLARKFGWRVPVPLLMAERYGKPLRGGPRGRIAPDEPQFPRGFLSTATVAGLSAARLATDVARRAQSLTAAAPKLRAKGAADVIDGLLGDDALPGSFRSPRLSRFASRRLFDRLLEFGVVRELSGRSAFRVFGL
ncbi:DUF1403 family protein [Rhizobium sp. TRM95111]|uniref:DUF1403 family protein n=1 Tax=Rhizobium alarense TaxID=2846851 RepID=UPI001F215955|nr:DUF1403 family protein [Rhizobium alarense]MCF3639660.1 DUF1403 family protein [Rhizobium alarense]